MKHHVWTAAVAAGFMLAACGDNAKTTDVAKPAEPTKEEVLAQGKYIVDSVGMCSDCHTPMLADNSGPDMTKYLHGAPYPGSPPPPGVPFAPNSVALAGLPTGYTEASLRTFMMTGEAGDGSPPLPPMPGYRLNEKDATAVAAYIASLPKPEPAPAAPPT
jgi:cytochrome c553